MKGYDTYAYLPEPDIGIGGGVGQADSQETAGKGLVTVYVEVEELQDMLDRAVHAGAEVALPATEINGVGTIARFRDPQGNVIGLVRSAAT